MIPWEDLGIAVPTWWWWFPEMTANFLFFGILIGLIGKLSEKDLVNTFVDSARDMVGVALIIGVARGITVIMNNGLNTDTVLYWAEQAVAGLGGIGFIIVTYLLYLPLYNGTRQVELGIPGGTTLAKAGPWGPGTRRPMVFYGTSIVQGGCASRPGMVHSAILGRRFQFPHFNLGFSALPRPEPAKRFQSGR